MAQRRMFAISVVETDEFYELPLTAQALYFHFSMNADDDGFISKPKAIQRIIGSSPGDYQTLIDSGFILPFDSGKIVVTHWNKSNQIQKDRYKPTEFSAERAQLYITENKEYSFCKNLNSDNVSTMDTECIQDGYIMDTQYSIDKNSIVKDSTVKNSLDKFSKEKVSQVSFDANFSLNSQYFDELWRIYPNQGDRKAAENAFKECCKDVNTYNQMLYALNKGNKYTERTLEQWLRFACWEDD